MVSVTVRTNAKGNPSHLSLIFRKSGDLGTKLKCIVCSKSGVILLMDIKPGMEGKKLSRYQDDIDKTSA